MIIFLIFYFFSHHNDDYLSELQNGLAIIRDNARQHLISSKQSAANRINNIPGVVKRIKTGDLIYLSNPVVNVGTSASLTPPFTGPFKVKEQLKNNNNLINNNGKLITVHEERLKPVSESSTKINNSPIIIPPFHQPDMLLTNKINQNIHQEKIINIEKEIEENNHSLDQQQEIPTNDNPSIEFTNSDQSPPIQDDIDKIDSNEIKEIITSNDNKYKIKFKEKK